MNAQIRRDKQYLSRKLKKSIKDFFDNLNFLLLLYNNKLKRIIVAYFAKIYIYKK